MKEIGHWELRGLVFVWNLLIFVCRSSRLSQCKQHPCGKLHVDHFKPFIFFNRKVLHLVAPVFFALCSLLYIPVPLSFMLVKAKARCFSKTFQHLSLFHPRLTWSSSVKLETLKSHPCSFSATGILAIANSSWSFQQDFQKQTKYPAPTASRFRCCWNQAWMVGVRAGWLRYQFPTGFVGKQTEQRNWQPDPGHFLIAWFSAMPLSLFLTNLWWSSVKRRNDLWFVLGFLVCFLLMLKWLFCLPWGKCYVRFCLLCNCTLFLQKN